MVFQDQHRRIATAPPSWLRRFAALLLIASSLWACGEGDNSVVNPEGSRANQSLPDSLFGVTLSEDRTYRPDLFSGASSILTVAQDMEVRSTGYLRFGLEPLPEADLVTRGEVTLRLADFRGGPFRLEAFEVAASAGDWEEAELRDEELELEMEPIATSDLVDPAAGDSTVVFELPGELVRRWKAEPETNYGLGVRLHASSSPGVLRVHSEESSTDATDPQIEIFRAGAISVIDRPSDDGYVLVPLAEPESGHATTLRIQEEIPWRALLRFPIDEVGLEAGDTINRARLTVRVEPGSVAESDSFVVSLHEALSEWTEAAEPDSVARSPEILDSEVVTAESDSLRFDLATVVQRWLDGADNHGVILRVATEGRGDTEVRIFSREAAAELRPVLDLVYTLPPGPRWEGPEDP